MATGPHRPPAPTLGRVSRITSDYLAGELEAAGAPAAMIQRARDGYYDEFKSPLAFPLMQLVHDSRAHRLAGIPRRVAEGDFDSTKEESDAWARSAEGRAAFQALVDGSGPPA
jgi:hypothetical protein